MSSGPSPPLFTGQRFRRALGLLGLLLLVSALPSSRGAPSAVHLALASFLSDALTFGAALGCFLRARGGGGEARGWRILALAFLLLGALNLPRTLAELFGTSVPMINLPLAFLLFIRTGLVGAAMLTWPLGPATFREGFRKALDGLIFTASFLFSAWVLVLGPAFEGSSLPPGLRTAILLYSLAYAVLFGISVYLGAEAPQRFLGPLGWLSAGTLLACVGNLVWAMLVLKGRWYPEHPFSLTTPLISACFLVCPWSPRPVGSAGEAALPGRGERALSLLFPYLPVLAALAVGCGAVLGNLAHLDRVAEGIALAVLLLMLVRQFLALRDVARAAEVLEERVQDRTLALRQAQELLVRTERMNTLGALGSGLAHDLKNLVCVLGNYSALVREDVRSGSPQLTRDLEAMEDASARALDLTQRLMALGHAGEHCVFDLTERTESLVGLLRAALPRTVSLEHEAEPVRLPIEGDPAALDQMVVNLVMNARDALPELRGRIRVETALDSPPGDGPSASLKVSDTGSGMSAEVRASLFTPFFSTKPAGQGTGLGLASVKQTLEAFGGSLDVDSAPGRGSEFRLRLPLRRPA